MSSPPIVIRAAARRDLELHYRWLVAEADVETADRFLYATDRAFVTLAGQPGMGPAVALRHSRLVRLRKWKVSGFPNVRIFYEPRTNGISVVRVVHAAQDWWALVGSEA